MSLTINKKPSSSSLTSQQLSLIEQKRQQAELKLKQNESTGLNTIIKDVTSSKPIRYDGKCVLLADDIERFEVQIGYNSELIALFKKIQTKQFNPDTKRWSFSIKKYDDLMQRIKFELKNPVKLEPLKEDKNKKNITCSFYLIDRNRFEVQTDRFDGEINEIFKQMKTKNYDAIKKKWSFSLSEYEKLFNLLNSNSKVVPLPKPVRETFSLQIKGQQATPPRIDPSFDLDTLNNKIDLSITKRLLPYQIEGVCFAIQQQGRLL
jgi:hypothetical protein